MEEERQSFMSSREAFVRRLCFWQVGLLAPWLIWMVWTAPLATHPGGLSALYYWVFLPGLLYVGIIVWLARRLQEKWGVVCPICRKRLGSQHRFEHVILTGKCPQCDLALFSPPLEPASQNTEAEDVGA